jgi:predicted dehydrogenase
MQHAIEALQAGKDVFVEKPMCETYAEARKMSRVAGRSRGNLYVRHNRRFEPGFMHIREIMKSGILGKVYEIKLRRNGYQRRDDWQTLMKFGGGQLLNWGPHIIDHALRMLESPCVELWSDLKLVAAVGDAEDHIKIVCKGKNDRLVDLEISGGSAIGEPECSVSGSKGALTCSGNEIHLRYLDPRKKLAVRRAKSGTPQGFGSPDNLKWIEKSIPVKAQGPDYKKDIRGHLYGTIRGGKKFPVPLDEAVQVIEIISKVRKGTKFDK